MVRNYRRKTVDRWSAEDLEEALACLRDGKMKINDVSKTYGISRATLYRQYGRFKDNGCQMERFRNCLRNCGGNPILSRLEEGVLENVILDLRSKGFTVSSQDIKRICFEYCEANHIPNRFHPENRMASDDWYFGFLKRHPKIIIRRKRTGNKAAAVTDADDETSVASLDSDTGSSSISDSSPQSTEPKAPEGNKTKTVTKVKVPRRKKPAAGKKPLKRLKSKETTSSPEIDPLAPVLDPAIKGEIIYHPVAPTIQLGIELNFS